MAGAEYIPKTKEYGLVPLRVGIPRSIPPLLRMDIPCQHATASVHMSEMIANSFLVP